MPTRLPQETIEAAVHGTRHAQWEIYRETSDRVFGLMVRIVGHQEAEDLTQQVFLRAFAKLTTFKNQSTFETWLYRLATNEALQSLRRAKHRKTEPLLSDPPSIDSSRSDRNETIEMVHQALRQLDPQLRTILSLKEDSCLSYQEIAEAIGIPEGTVGSRLSRARRELRALLVTSGHC
jgi:RNA polymerase sigma-70 factor (ECF subfamily)